MWRFLLRFNSTNTVMSLIYFLFSIYYCVLTKSFYWRWLITGRNEVVAKVIFLHLFVILFTGGVVVVVVSQKALRQTPPGADTPRDQTPPGSRPPPGSRHPLPREQTPPPGADSGIRSTSGRYASYWNAFLFHIATCSSCYRFPSFIYFCADVMCTFFSLTFQYCA